MTQAVLAAHNYSTRAIELIIEALKNIREAFNSYNEIRTTEKELGRLSDKDLLDIGLCRGDIYSIARGHQSVNRSVDTTVNRNLKGWI